MGFIQGSTGHKSLIQIIWQLMTELIILKEPGDLMSTSLLIFWHLEVSENEQFKYCNQCASLRVLILQLTEHSKNMFSGSIEFSLHIALITMAEGKKCLSSVSFCS